MINIYFFDRPDLRDMHIIQGVRDFGSEFSSSGIVISTKPNDLADFNICVDTGHCLPSFPKKKETSAFWCAHCYNQIHIDFCKNFGTTFGVDLHYVEAGLYDFWVPNGVGLSSYQTKEEVFQKYDLGFFGQYVGVREDTLNRIASICDKYGFSYNFVDTRKDAIGEEVPTRKRPYWKDKGAFLRSMKECRVLVNATTHPHLHLLNSRIFEGIAVGRVVFSDIIKGTRELAPEEHGVVYYRYQDSENIETKLRRLLADGKYYDATLIRGKPLLEKNTVRARLLSILAKLGVEI